MKTKLFFLFPILFLYLNFKAQNTSNTDQNDAMATTAIYDFDWFIDPELVNRTTFNMPNDGITGDGFNRLFISQNLLDSVVRTTEQLIGEKVPSITKCAYRTDKRGRQIATRNSIQTVGGLPSSSKKKALLAFERDYYADVLIRIGTTRGPIIGDVYGTNVSRLRPYIVLKVKVFDQEKKRVYRNRVRLRNFDKITRFQVAIAGVNMTNRNALSQEQIAEMVFMAIEKLRAK